MNVWCKCSPFSQKTQREGWTDGAKTLVSYDDACKNEYLCSGGLNKTLSQCRRFFSLVYVNVKHRQHSRAAMFDINQMSISKANKEHSINVQCQKLAIRLMVVRLRCTSTTTGL